MTKERLIGTLCIFLSPALLVAWLIIEFSDWIVVRREKQGQFGT